LKYELFHGRGYEFAGTFPDQETMRAAWELHRDALREEWRNTNPPGTRCFAEWLFELVPTYGERRTTRFYEPMRPYRENWLVQGILHTHLVPAAQESEAEYLDRHNLLSDTEREELGEVVCLEEEHAKWMDELAEKYRTPFSSER
jgi:hypothetical protein